MDIAARSADSWRWCVAPNALSIRSGAVARMADVVSESTMTTRAALAVAAAYTARGAGAVMRAAGAAPGIRRSGNAVNRGSRPMTIGDMPPRTRSARSPTKLCTGCQPSQTRSLAHLWSRRIHDSGATLGRKPGCPPPQRCAAVSFAWATRQRLAAAILER